MGNCAGKSEKLTAEIVPHDGAAVCPAVRLCGSPHSVVAAYTRFVYLQSSASSTSASDTAPPTTAARGRVFRPENPVTLRIRPGDSSESRDALLRLIDVKFPDLLSAEEVEAPVVADVAAPVVKEVVAPVVKEVVAPVVEESDGGGEEETRSLVVRAVELQHKSMMWHVERMVKWAEDLATRGGRRAIDPKVGTWKMEVVKFGRSYSQLLDFMLEHAQMEERVLFPIFDKADRGLSKAAKEEHARDLPIMNGIKEIIKSVEVLDSRSPNYKDTLCNLSTRLKSLQGKCKQHFMEEELELLPIMEAVELSKEQDESALEQSFVVMQGTHGRLLKFLLEGLTHHDAMKYLDLISMCRDKERMECMLRMVVK